MTLRALLLASVFTLAAQTAHAQLAEDEYDEVIVTSSRLAAPVAIGVTQSGVQDVAFFRNTLDAGRLPAPASLRSEGLLSEHDLPLPGSEPCAQLFCVSLASMPAELPLRPEVDALIGVGFDSLMAHPDTFQRAPVTLIATVDTSGSMRGKPIETARAAMLMALGRLQPGDRMGLVQYANGVQLAHPVIDVGQGRASLRAAIEALEAGGSTAMESGLKLAFATAREARAPGRTTRVMLFTDEQPNVGSQDPTSFRGMATAAAADGVGLSTIGVSDSFGAAHAAEVAEADGANQFFVADAEAAKALFAEEFDFMLTEVARDLVVDIVPSSGATITEIFGVPGDAVERRRGGLRLRVPSVFLSAQSGGLFLAVEGSESPVVRATVTYLDPRTGERGQHRAVAARSEASAPGLARAHRLVDQYTVMQAAMEAGLFDADASAATGAIDAYLARLATDQDAELDVQAEMMATLRKVVQSHTAEAPTEVDGRMASLLGAWDIVRVRNRGGQSLAKDRIDLRRGDRIAFHIAQGEWEELMTFNARRSKPKGDEPRVESETVLLDPHFDRVVLTESELAFRFVPDGERLRLRLEDSDIELVLRRVAAKGPARSDDS